MKTINSQKSKKGLSAGALSKQLAKAVGKEVRLTRHGHERLIERFSGSLNTPIIGAIKEAIRLLDVQWTRKKVRVERSEALVVLARNGKAYEVVTLWDPRYEKAK